MIMRREETRRLIGPSNQNTSNKMLETIDYRPGRSVSGKLLKPMENFSTIATGNKSIMSLKYHGTSDVPVQDDLRWGCNYFLADHLCNFNSLKKCQAEPAGYWRQTSFFEEAKQAQADNVKITFYDSNTGKPLFRAPRGRSWDDFLGEVINFGWLSFRDKEVVLENIRCLRTCTVSLAGTHLGSNMPDRHGNRYCINLVSISGHPADDSLPFTTNSSSYVTTGTTHEQERTEKHFESEQWFDNHISWVEALPTTGISENKRLYTKTGKDFTESDVDTESDAIFCSWPSDCTQEFKYPTSANDMDNENNLKEESKPVQMPLQHSKTCTKDAPFYGWGEIERGTRPEETFSSTQLMIFNKKIVLFSPQNTAKCSRDASSFGDTDKDANFSSWPAERLNTSERSSTRTICKGIKYLVGSS